MPGTLPFDLSAFQVKDTTLISGIQSFSMDPVLETIVNGGDGRAEPTSVSTTGGDPRMDLDVQDLELFFDQIGAEGLAIDGIGLNPAHFYMQKRSEAGKTDPAAVHEQYTVAKGIIYPVRLDAQNRGLAMVTCAVLCTYDGASDPIVFTGSAALPALTVASKFTLGPVSIGGVKINSVKRFSIDFGLRVITDSGGGDTYPTVTAIMAHQPSAQFVTNDVEQARLLKLEGSPISGGDSLFYCRKLQTDSIIHADGSAEHIRANFAAGKHEWTLSSQHNQPGQVTVNLRARDNLSASILTVTTGVAIT